MLKIVAMILQEMMRLWTKMENEMHHGLMKLRHWSEIDRSNAQSSRTSHWKWQKAEVRDWVKAPVLRNNIIIMWLY